MIARISYAILRRMFNLYVSLFDGRGFKSDKNYNLNSIDDFFLDHKSNISNKDIFQRVSSAYNKAKITQNEAHKDYQVGNEWIPKYNNFLREKCITGLTGIGGYERMTGNYFSGKISIKNAQRNQARSVILNRINLNFFKPLIFKIYKVVVFSMSNILNKDDKI
jgi:hypothetical protein